MRPFSALLAACAAIMSVAADFKDVDPNVFPKDDPRAKELPKMMWADAKKRMQEANLRESKAFAEVTTKEQWEKYRDARVQRLKESLGTFPDVPKDMKIKVTRELDGEGYVIHNVVYETRPGLWVSANLYLPAKMPDKMPGIIISHAHHTPKTHGELQDMGMLWARSGVAVLVPDHLGHGERRQHDFVAEKDYDKPFRPSRQDYYFRYNSNLQLSAAGESLMGWMVWDLMRGVDVLLRQKNIDRSRIILLGAVAGGGDPAGVTAALDKRITCVVPFNFGGWQPESSVLDNPDRDFAWFGEGYWESTRGLKNGARDGFAHFVIVGSVAPRPVIYAHEFAWEAKADPAWPRLQKIFGFYDAKDKLAVAHGKGKVTGPGGPDNTHCTHIGAVHRKMIYPALKEWFGMPIPEEYSKRRPAEDLMCWTDEAKKELKPKKLGEVVRQFVKAREEKVGISGLQLQTMWANKYWRELFDDIEPRLGFAVEEGKSEEMPGGTLSRYLLKTESGIHLAVLLIMPKNATGKVPVAVMVASAGKGAFLKERVEAIAALLDAGVAVCLPDLRGTGETRPGESAGRGSSRTSVSQTEQILGRSILVAQLRDLRTAIRWAQDRPGIDGKRLVLWGDSFAKTNAADTKVAVPLDAPDVPHVAEPNAALLVTLARFLDGATAVYTRGGLADYESILTSPYVYLPHDAVFPVLRYPPIFLDVGWRRPSPSVKHDAQVDVHNRLVGDKPMSPADAAKWVIEQLAK